MTREGSGRIVVDRATLPWKLLLVSSERATSRPKHKALSSLLFQEEKRRERETWRRLSGERESSPDVPESTRPSP